MPAKSTDLDKLKPYLEPLSDNQRKFILALYRKAADGGWRGSQAATYNDPRVAGNKAKFYYWRKHHPAFLEAFRAVESFFVSRIEEASQAETAETASTVRAAIQHLEENALRAAETLTDALDAEVTKQVGFKIGDDGKPIPDYEKEEDYTNRIKASKLLFDRTVENDTMLIMRTVNPHKLHPVLRNYWRENVIKSWRDVVRMLELTGDIGKENRL